MMRSMRTRSVGWSVVLLSILGVAHPAQTQECKPQWASEIFNTGGWGGPIHALSVFDDGQGPRLYIANDDGATRWSAFSEDPMPFIGDPVLALTLFDDGAGEALYAGGQFTEIEDVAINRVAKWDGAAWSPLGEGLADTVHAVVAFDDGNGATLYAGGDFFEVLFEGVHSIARWDGVEWIPVQTGLDGVFNDLNGAVYALAVYDDGSGESLVAGGEFTLASGVEVNRIAKWDGEQWSAFGAGMDAPVFALTVFDDGSGDALFAGGAFASAGESDASRIAKWDGAQWIDLQGGVDGDVYAFATFDDEERSALWVGGEFGTAGAVASGFVAVWNGDVWSEAGSGVVSGSGDLDGVYAIDVFGSSMYIGGDFALSLPDASPTTDLARWDGADWVALGQGIGGLVEVALVSDFDPAVGPSLYVAGDLNDAGEIHVTDIARWDGSRWWPLAGGANGNILDLAVFDDGLGPALYVAGDNFGHTGDGLLVNHIAKWDGEQWHALDGGIEQASLGALEVFDAGRGPELYVGGSFQSTNVPGDWIVKWDGDEWSAVGDGIDGAVAEMVVFDDGSGPALFVGGGFDTAGGNTVNSIAKWDGQSWSPLGAGVGGIANPSVTALAEFDDGNGSALYAAGNFTAAGGVAANYIARWDGKAWSAVGTGTDGFVGTLQCFDDGNGVSLFAGGEFEQVGRVQANHIARWDGEAWFTVDSGMDNSVKDFVVFPDEAAPRLHAVGYFNVAGDAYSLGIAKWLHCLPPTPGDLDGDGDVDGADLIILLGAWGECDDCEGCIADLDHDCDVDGSDLILLLGNWG